MDTSQQEAVAPGAPVEKPAARIRFGSFELDREAGEIRKGGLRLRIQEKPLQALLLLTGRPGRLVTRDELIAALWPDDEYGDFDHGVNLAINRLRSVLRDRADSPRFVETVPRRGYRFIAPVESVVAAAPAPPRMPAAGPEIAATLPGAAAGRPAWRASGLRVLAISLVLFALVSISSSMSLLAPQPASTAGRAVLLVLPFHDLSPEPAEYLSQGLTAELIARLGRLDPEQLGVIAFTTALQYEDTTRSVDEIARELGVQYVVEGSLTRTDDHIRVNVQLIKAADQTALLSESYDRRLEGILDVERTVAASVTSSLTTEVLDLEPRPVREATAHPEAYMAFLRGRFLQSQRTDASLRQSVEELARAIEISPTFAMAYALEAQSFALFPSYGISMPSDAMPQAKAAARRALELDSELAEAHAALALVRWTYDWDFEGARESFRKATAFNANYAPAHQWYANFLLSMGDFDGARSEMDRALELDPLSLAIHTGVALVDFYARDYDRAILQCRKTLELQPYFASGQELLALAYAQKGAYATAIEGLGELLDGMPTPAFLTSMAQIHALAGERERALAVLDSLLRTAAYTGSYVPPYRVALVYSALEEKDEAFRWLDAALEDRAYEMSLLAVDPRLDPLRGDPRFEALLEKVGLDVVAGAVVGRAGPRRREAEPRAVPSATPRGIGGRSGS